MLSPMPLPAPIRFTSPFRSHSPELIQVDGASGDLVDDFPFSPNFFLSLNGRACSAGGSDNLSPYAFSSSPLRDAKTSSKTRSVSKKGSTQTAPSKKTYSKQRGVSNNGLRSGTSTVVPTRHSSPTSTNNVPSKKAISTRSSDRRGRSSAKRAVGLSRLDIGTTVSNSSRHPPPSYRKDPNANQPVGLNTTNLPRVGVDVCVRWLTGRPPAFSAASRKTDKNVASRLTIVLKNAISDIKMTVGDLEMEKSMCILQSLHKISIVDLENYWEVVDLEERIEDLKQCVERVEKLRDELVQKKRMRPIVDYDDEMEDSIWWNETIRSYKKRKSGFSWSSTPPLFAEAYVYRRLKECFAQSIWWRNYDPFRREKCGSFFQVAEALPEIAARFSSPFHSGDCLFPWEHLEVAKEQFMDLTKVYVRGNVTYSSSLIKESDNKPRELHGHGGAALEDAEESILGGQVEALWTTLERLCVTSKPEQKIRVDFVLNDAGFELFCDLAYADFLIQSGLVDEVRFHGKQMPWFVSNATGGDWSWMMDALLNPQVYPNSTPSSIQSFRELGERWRGYEQSGKFVYEQHPFWTTGLSFWDLPTHSRTLIGCLSSSSLIIFKGGLNHRRLTHDWTAPPGTSFDEMVGPVMFHPKSPTLCSFRAVKEELVVELSKGGQRRVEILDSEGGMSSKHKASS